MSTPVNIVAHIHRTTRGSAQRPVRTLTFVCLPCRRINGVPLDDDETDVTGARCSYCGEKNTFITPVQERVVTNQAVYRG